MSQFISAAPIRLPLRNEDGKETYISRNRGWTDWFLKVRDAINNTVRQHVGLVESDTNPGIAFNNTIVQEVPGMQVQLAKGVWYGFRMELAIECPAAGGYKWALQGTSLPVNAFCQIDIIENDNTLAAAGTPVVNAWQQCTGAWSLTLDRLAASNPSYVYAFLRGVIHCAEAGTFGLWFCQKVVSGTTYLNAGTNLLLWDLT